MEGSKLGEKRGEHSLVTYCWGKWIGPKWWWTPPWERWYLSSYVFWEVLASANRTKPTSSDRWHLSLSSYVFWEVLVPAKRTIPTSSERWYLSSYVFWEVLLPANRTKPTSSERWYLSSYVFWNVLPMNRTKPTSWERWYLSSYVFWNVLPMNRTKSTSSDRWYLSSYVLLGSPTTSQHNKINIMREMISIKLYVFLESHTRKQHKSNVIIKLSISIKRCLLECPTNEQKKSTSFICQAMSFGKSFKCQPTEQNHCHHLSSCVFL